MLSFPGADYHERVWGTQHELDVVGDVSCACPEGVNALAVCCCLSEPPAIDREANTSQHDRERQPHRRQGECQLSGDCPPITSGGLA